jgi:hypothetical protein
MKTTAFCFAGVLAATTPALANSSFQKTCSDIHFASMGDEAALEATCLRVDGAPHHSTLMLKGISNQNGVLTPGHGHSTFQQTCRDVEILVNNSEVALSAHCATVDGRFVRSMLPLDDISNQDGQLTW